MKRIRLFCLPYAGGLAGAYNAWRPHLNGWIDLCPVELAGHGVRWSEPPYRDFDEAVNDLCEAIRPRLAEGPYAIFGHSMGSWLAFELYHKIVAHGLTLPEHLFLSGRRAPHAPHNGPLLHCMSDEDFEAELLRMGGTSKKLLEHQELRALFLDTIRADIKILEEYRMLPREARVECPVTVLSGRQDHTLVVRELFGWRSLVAGPCSIRCLEGGHFFLTQNPGEVARVINQILDGCLARV